MLGLPADTLTRQGPSSGQITCYEKRTDHVLPTGGQRSPCPDRRVRLACPRPIQSRQGEAGILIEEANMAAEFPVVFALYPRVTQLDFTGPHEVFARLPGAECVLASAAGGDIEAYGGIVFTG